MASKSSLLQGFEAGSEAMNPFAESRMRQLLMEQQNKNSSDLKNRELQQQMGLKYLEMQKSKETDLQKRLNDVYTNAQKLAFDEWKSYKDSGQVVSLDELTNKRMLEGLKQQPELIDEIERRSALQNSAIQQQQQKIQQQKQQQETQKAQQGAMQTMGNVDITYKPNDSTTIKTTGDTMAALAMNPVTAPKMQGLIRATFYNPTEDQYGSQTAKPNPNTGVNQAQELTTVAVDPREIPYGSKVEVPELAKKLGLPENHLFVAHDTGGAVKSRQASGGTTPIMDVYTNSPQQMNEMANRAGTGGYGYRIVSTPEQAKGDTVVSDIPTLGAKPASFSSDVGIMSGMQKVQNMHAPEQTPSVMPTDKTPIPSAEEASLQSRGIAQQATQSTQQPLNNQLNSQLSMAEQQLAAKLKADEEAKRQKEKIEQDRFDLSRKQYELSNRQYEEERPYKSAQLRKMELDSQKVDQELSQMKTGVAGEFSGLPEKKQNMVINLKEKFDSNKQVQDYQQAKQSLASIKELSLSPQTAQTDIAMVYSFMRALDPTSTVREGEYATAKNAAGVPQQITNAYNQLVDGRFLTSDQRKNFLKAANTSVEGKRKNYEQVRESWKKQVKSYGIDKPEWVIGFDDEEKDSTVNNQIAEKQIEQIPTLDPKKEEEINNELSKHDTVDTLANAVFNSALVNFGDEALGSTAKALGTPFALMKGMKLDDFYKKVDEKIAEQATERKVVAQEHPILSGAANIVGGLVSGMALPFGKIAQAVKGAKFIPSALKGISGLGAETGAFMGIYGAGENGDIVKRGKEALKQGSIGAIGGAALGAGGLAAGKMLPSIDAVVKPIIRNASEKWRIPMSYTQAGGSPLVKTLTSTAEQIPFTGARLFRDKQQLAFNKGIAKTIGEEGVEKITPEVIDSAYKNIGNKFNQVYAGEKIQIGEETQKALSELLIEAENSITESGVKIVKNNIKEFLNSVDANTGVILGEKLGASISQLSKRTRGIPNEATRYLHELQDVLVDTISINNPEKAALLREARYQYKNLKTIEPLAEKAKAGNINPSLLLEPVRKNFKDFSRGGGGDLGELARIGQLIKGEIPDSGTTLRLLTAGGLGAMGAGASIATGGTALLGALKAYLGLIGYSAANTSQTIMKRLVK